jgi:membrane-associated protease RseP (regulator of RpoE activity)
MATLSLFMFNLLPLPHLDGDQLLKCILSEDVLSGAEMELRDVEWNPVRTSPSIRRPGVREMLATSLPKVTAGLMTCIVLGGLLNMIIHGF